MILLLIKSKYSKLIKNIYYLFYTPIIEIYYTL